MTLALVQCGTCKQEIYLTPNNEDSGEIRQCSACDWWFHDGECWEEHED